jgi:hypothetical protein
MANYRPKKKFGQNKRNKILETRYKIQITNNNQESRVQIVIARSPDYVGRRGNPGQQGDFYFFGFPA